MVKSLSAQKWPGGVFCLVCLLCFTEEILIVRAEADRETSDAADQSCRPHTDVWGGDFHGARERLQNGSNVLLKMWIKNLNYAFLHGEEDYFSLLRFPRQVTTSSACTCHQVDTEQQVHQYELRFHTEWCWTRVNMCMLFCNVYVAQ